MAAAPIALGTIAYTGGMLIGAIFRAGLTIPLVLPLVGGSWRLDLVVLGASGAPDRAGVLAAQPERR